MKVPRVVKAMEYIDDDLINGAITYKPQKKKPIWVKWGAMVACLCLVLIVAIPIVNHFNNPNVDDGYNPVEGTQDTPSQFIVDGNTFMISPYLLSFDTLPEGYSFTGQIDIDGHGSCPYYTNPDVPEWIYVYHEVSTNGDVDATGTIIRTEPHDAYVRYIDVRLRGRDLLRCGDDIYISMWSVNLYDTPDVSQEYHNSVKEKYGNRIEGDAPTGFVLVGTASFSGYDTIPNDTLSVNTEEAEVYLSDTEPDIALVTTHWYTAPKEKGENEVRHDGFNVYIRYECPIK